MSGESEASSTDKGKMSSEDSIVRLLGLIGLEQILEELKEEGLAEFDRYELRDARPTEKHVIILWKGGKRLGGIRVTNSHIDEIPIIEQTRTCLKWCLREAIWQRQHKG